MSYIFLIIAIVIAVFDWLAVYRQWQYVEWVCKPATMLALLAFLVTNGGWKGTPLWFAGGLLFSLAGDVFLMLPNKFLAGLISFLIAHLCYLVGFNLPETNLNLVVLILAVVVGLTGFQVYKSISRGLIRSGKIRLRFPILIYSIVISLMLLSAMATLTGEVWAPVTAIFVSSGALLFFISDVILALNRFVRPIRYGRVANMICYHAGQILLTVGVVLQLLS